MPTRRISMCDGPCKDNYVTAGGLFGRPPQALWAIRDEDGDIGCIKGEAGRPPELDYGETVLGCYEYDPSADGYVWRPARRDRWHPSPHRGEHRLLR